MRKAQKRLAENYVRLLSQAHDGIKKAMELKKDDIVKELLEQCQEAAIKLGGLIEEAEGEDFPTIPILEEYCETIYQMYIENGQKEKTNINKKYKILRQSLIKIENSVRKIKVRIEAVFLPYKASMWDSLESVWKAADEDPDCDAYVIPIPYFDKNPDGSFRDEHYEGGQYPEYVPVTNYNEYNIEERRPDMIFIHNPYDECNYVTSVPCCFYSSNLKKYTENLVYIPYFILDEIEPNNDEVIQSMKHFCMVPGVFNADKVIVQSEDMKKVYIKVLLEETGDKSAASKEYWNKKILGLGSPKIDKVLSVKDNQILVPDKWKNILEKPDGSRKKIILYNTSITALLKHNERIIEKIENNFEIFKENKEEVALLWRPHPLIESTLISMRPKLWTKYKMLRDKYIQEQWGIYDDTPDIDRAIAISDAYYGDPSSVIQLFQQTGKPIMVQNIEVET